MNDVSQLKYNEEKMIARLSRQLQYLAQTRSRGVRIYETNIKDIPRFGESLQIIENEDYLNEIKKQEDEVNVLSVDNVKENTKKMDIDSASSKNSKPQYSTNNKDYSGKIINKDKSNSIIKLINTEQGRKRDFCLFFGINNLGILIIFLNHHLNPESEL